MQLTLTSQKALIRAYSGLDFEPIYAQKHSSALREAAQQKARLT